MSKQTLIRAGIYKHYKGNTYKVIGIAKHSETTEDMVVYRSTDDEHQLWVRTLKEFCEQVKVDERLTSRFQFIK